MHGMHFSARVLLLVYFSFINLLVVFTIKRTLFTQISFSHGFLLFEGFIEMDVKSFVVGVFFFVIILMVAFINQSKNNEIL